MMHCLDHSTYLPSSKRAEIPVYSFAQHARLPQTTSIYSPHVLILEGIFALYDPRVLELIDMGVCSAAALSLLRTDLSRYTVRQMAIPVYHDEVGSLAVMNVQVLTLPSQVVRDLRDRGRDVEGCIKQWFAFVKPNFEKVRCKSLREQRSGRLMSNRTVRRAAAQGCQPDRAKGH
jgi:uridine kinase